MKQLIIRRMTASDLIWNIFYKFRFWFYRKFLSRKIQRISTTSKEGWELTFNDDFNQVSWSRDEKKKWRVANGWGEFHPDFPHTYDGPPELVKNTSCARFSVIYNPKTFPDDKRTGKPITIPFRKSLVSTSHRLRQQYGRFECRCQIPYHKGVWPAFWLWGVNGGRYSEIDIFELYGRRDGSTAGIQEINLHYGMAEQKPSWEKMKSWKVKITDPEPIGLLHEFVMEWSPGKIEMFTDGVKIFRYTRKDVLEKWFGEDTKLWIVLNHSIDPKYVKKEDKDYYSEYLVDYVRAYKRKT